MNNALDLFRSRPSSQPWREINRLQESMDRLMSGFMNGQEKSLDQIEFSPTCELTEDDKKYTFKFDLPGVPKDKVKVALDGQVLTVSAERQAENKESTAKTHLSEVFYGSYSRSFTFPNSVDDKQVEAKYENGVLKVTVPKSAQAQRKAIAIK